MNVQDFDKQKPCVIIPVIYRALSRSSQLTNRHESRTKAYRYIIEQVKKGNLGPGHDIEETLADVDYISLGDLVKLKEGLVDPSPE